MRAQCLADPGSPLCDTRSSNEISSVLDLRGGVLTCLISSGYRVILCTAKNIQQESGDKHRYYLLGMRR